jgi:type II secretory pathway component PulK
MAVLWLIAVLAMATMAALRVISFDTRLTSAKIHGSRARQFAEMGIAVGCNPAVKRVDPILHQMNDDEGFEAKILSEGGRFNINYLLLQGEKPLLTSIFCSWGLDVKEAQHVVDCLTDWVDADDDESLNGAEKKTYEALGRINQPFNRPFYDLSEMRLVLGMDRVEAANPKWRDWFTVWSGGALDLNEANAELIAAAAECPVEQAAVIPETVRGADGELDTEDDARFQNVATALELLGIDANARPDLAKRFTVNDTTTRIESIGHAEGATRKITVVVRNRTGKPALLERTEEITP